MGGNLLDFIFRRNPRGRPRPDPPDPDPEPDPGPAPVPGPAPAPAPPARPPGFYEPTAGRLSTTNSSVAIIPAQAPSGPGGHRGYAPGDSMTIEVRLVDELRDPLVGALVRLTDGVNALGAVPPAGSTDAEGVFRSSYVFQEGDNGRLVVAVVEHTNPFGHSVASLKPRVLEGRAE